MEMIAEFLKESNRWKHLAGGFAVGLLALHPLGALYGAAVAASCLELKDMLWGGRWDWLDWVFTVAGGAVASVAWWLVWECVILK